MRVHYSFPYHHPALRLCGIIWVTQDFAVGISIVKLPERCSRVSYTYGQLQDFIPISRENIGIASP